MGEQESAHLILAIDASRAKDGALQFSVSANQVKTAATEAAKANEGVTKSTDRVGSSFDAVSKKLLAYAAAYFSIREISRVTFQQEEAEYKLAAAINLTGSARTAALANLKDFSKEVQRLTTYDDALILADMAYAKNLGITTNELKNVTLAAIGLSTKYNIDLETAILSISRASQGLPVILRGTAINLDDCTTAQEKYNKLLRMGTDAFRLATEQASSASGSWKQIKNELSEVAEEFGKLMLPGIKQAKSPVIAFLEDLKWKLDEIPVSIQTAKTNIANLASAGAHWWTNAGSTFGNLGPTLSGSMVTADETRAQLNAAQEIERKALEQNQRMKAMMLSRKAGTAVTAGVETPPGPSAEEIKAQSEATLKLYSDMYGGMKASGLEYYSSIKQYDDQYRAAFLANLEIQKKEYLAKTKDQSLVDTWYNNQRMQFEKQLGQEQKEVIYQRAQITAEMYESMQNYGDDYIEAQKALLRQQYEDYAKFIQDKDLLDKWYANQLEKIKQDTSFTWQQLRGVVDETKGALSDFFMTFENGEDVLYSFGKAVQRMFANIAAEIAMYQALMMLGMNPGSMGVQNPLGGGGGGGGGASAGGGFNFGQFAGNIGAGISSWMQSWFAPSVGGPSLGSGYVGGGSAVPVFTDLPPIDFGTFHSGGIAGVSSVFRRRVPMNVFSLAPRLHGGLQPDEVPAIVQKGERWQSKAEVASEKNKPAQQQKVDLKVRNIIVRDDNEIPNAMAGSKGEKVIVTHLRNLGVM